MDYVQVIIWTHNAMLNMTKVKFELIKNPYQSIQEFLWKVSDCII